MQTIDQELEFNVSWASEVMRQTGQLQPMAIVDGEAGRMPVVMSFETPEQKDSNYRLIKLLALAYDATQIVLLTESWVTILRADGSVERRTEALTVTVVRRDGERSTNLEIQRNGDGSFAGLLPDPNLADSVVVESRISHALPKEPVSDWHKRSARDVLKLFNIEPTMLDKPSVH